MTFNPAKPCRRLERIEVQSDLRELLHSLNFDEENIVLKEVIELLMKVLPEHVYVEKEIE